MSFSFDHLYHIAMFRRIEFSLNYGFYRIKWNHEAPWHETYTWIRRKNECLKSRDFIFKNVFKNKTYPQMRRPKSESIHRCRWISYGYAAPLWFVSVSPLPNLRWKAYLPHIHRRACRDHRGIHRCRISNYIQFQKDEVNIKFDSWNLPTNHWSKSTVEADQSVRVVYWFYAIYWSLSRVQSTTKVI